MGDPAVYNSAGCTSKPLSCINCRRKKMKCDRRHPCTQCTASKVECVVPQRRSPWPKRRKNLRATLATRPYNYGDDPPLLTSPSSCDQEGPQTHHATRITKDSVDLGGTFWELIRSEVAGFADDVELADIPGSRPRSGPSASSSLFAHLFGANQPPVPGPALKKAAARLTITSVFSIRKLYGLFFSNVDPVFKVLHHSSLCWDGAFPEDITSFREGTAPERCLWALTCAICFAAATSLSEETCLADLGEPRSRLLGTWRHEVESALGAADPSSTSDLSILQAFTIYTMVLRCHDSSHRTTVLVALAIRLAQIAGLHREELISSHSIFEQEMRRRLWAQLLVLDMRCAEDRGLQPVISPTQYNTELPVNINDEDFDAYTMEPLESRHGPTQMTYSLASVRVAVLVNSIMEGPSAAQDSNAGLEDKLHEISVGIENLELRFPDSGSDYEQDDHVLHSRGVQTLIRAVTFKLWLYLHYPVYARFSAFPTTAPESSRLLVISASILLLLEELSGDKRLARFHWFLSTFILWHPLAVLLAKTCLQTDGDVIKKSWPLVERAHRECGRLVADGSSGGLWRLISLLYDRAQVSMIMAHSEVILPPLKIPKSKYMGHETRICWTDENDDQYPRMEEAMEEPEWSFDTPCFYF